MVRYIYLLFFYVQYLYIVPSNRKRNRLIEVQLFLLSSHSLKKRVPRPLSGRLCSLQRRELITVRGQTYVLRLPKSWPPTPLSARWVCCGGSKHSLGGEGGGGSIFWKTQDTALYSAYIESSLVYSLYDRILYVLLPENLRAHLQLSV